MDVYGLVASSFRISIVATAISENNAVIDHPGNICTDSGWCIFRRYLVNIVSQILPGRFFVRVEEIGYLTKKIPALIIIFGKLTAQKQNGNKHL